MRVCHQNKMSRGFSTVYSTSWARCKAHFCLAGRNSPPTRNHNESRVSIIFSESSGSCTSQLLVDPAPHPREYGTSRKFMWYSPVKGGFKMRRKFFSVFFFFLVLSFICYFNHNRTDCTFIYRGEGKNIPPGTAIDMSNMQPFVDATTQHSRRGSFRCSPEYIRILLFSVAFFFTIPPACQPGFSHKHN